MHSAPPPVNDGLLLWLRDPQNIPDKWSYYLLLVTSYYYVAVNNSYWLSRYLCIANVVLGTKKLGQFRFRRQFSSEKIRISVSTGFNMNYLFTDGAAN